MSRRGGELVASSQVFDGRVLDVRIERVRMPNELEVDLEIIRHPGAAAVVPVTTEGDVVMLRQYRHATGGYLLEVPAGKLDEPGEDPEACARRELEEETGLRAGRLDSLGWIWTSPGFADEKIWLYLATELAPGRQNLEADEVLEVERIPLAEVVEMAHYGRITDAKSICALSRAVALMKR